MSAYAAILAGCHNFLKQGIPADFWEEFTFHFSPTVLVMHI